MNFKKFTQNPSNSKRSWDDLGALHPTVVSGVLLPNGVLEIETGGGALDARVDDLDLLGCGGEERFLPLRLLLPRWGHQLFGNSGIVV